MKTLIIVVTRRTASKGGGIDEFVQDWNIKSSDIDEDSCFFVLSDVDTILLLIHGHDKMGRTLDAIQSEKNKEFIETKKNIGDILLFYHDKPEHKIEKLFKRDVTVSFEYSSLGKQSSTFGFLDKLKEAGIQINLPNIEEISKAISKKCIVKTKIQTIYLNQIRELLLSLQLSVSVASNNNATTDIINEAVENTLKAHKKIKALVQHPVIKSLSTNTSIDENRLFVIWDIVDPPSMRCTFSGFEISWQCKDFWEACIYENNIEDIIKKVEMKSFNHDLKWLSIGINKLLLKLKNEERQK